jgi:hypothetical protein
LITLRLVSLVELAGLEDKIFVRGLAAMAASIKVE